MRLKGVIIEDFVNYKEPSLFLSTCECDWKCCTEGGFDKSVCQNYSLNKAETKEYNDEDLVKAFIFNPITKAVVIGGLEPFLQFDELLSFLATFKHYADVGKFSGPDVVIYTGYDKEEVEDKVKELKKVYPWLIIKYGRYIPNQNPHYDEVLGIFLASDNQYAERVG